jgi:predicted aldo/keto reductase-like oxidoreductase
MQYRKFGKLDWKPSALGFGAMRLPLMEAEPTKIDEPEAIRMIRYAIDHGVNYVDTAYGYHAGNSERVVGKALKDGYREKVKLATKMPVPRIETASDFDTLFNEQLSKLQTDKIDFYLMHGLDVKRWGKVRDMGVLKWAESQMAKGRIGKLGFSFHDSFDSFKSVVNDYDNWTFCQLQYNYMDIDFQAGRRGIEIAAKKGMAVIVMEPLRGGKLAVNPPEKVAKVWDTAKQKRSPVEWGLQWVWSQPEVSLALSGMSKMEQVVQNLEIADRSRVGLLTAEEMALVAHVREVFTGLAPIPCTACEYCMPCPNGVEIPTIFNIYNEAAIYGDLRRGQSRYQGRGRSPLTEKQRGDQCLDCGKCVELCPQKVAIPDWLKKVHSELLPK